MRVVFATNVVLDVLLDREPFSTAATSLFCAVEESRIDALLCATTLTTIEYLLGQTMSANRVKKVLSRLLELFDVATVNRTVIHAALQSGMRDFEDAVLAHSAHLAGADAVITRNGRDFRHSPVKIFTPADFLTLL